MDMEKKWQYFVQNLVQMTLFYRRPTEEQKHNMPLGTAHFIEHKLFQMPEGDAFSQFSQYHASANAYTDTEKTIYYFTTTMELYPPLELFIKNVFYSVFS